QAAAGTTLLELGVQDSAPASMFWTSNSSLSFPVAAPASIQTLPLGGGPPVVLTTAVAHHIWLANGGLVFSSGGDDKVWQIPIGGGDPTLIADGMTTGPPSYNAVGADTYDAADFYWDLRPSSGPPFWSLWAMAIPGGGAKKLADLPEPSGPPLNWRRLIPSVAGLVVAFENLPQVGAYLVPTTGGAAETLPGPPPFAGQGENQVLGLSQTAILWDTESADPASAVGATVTLGLTDLSPTGSPVFRTFWPDHPSSFVPSTNESWSGGSDGSWLIGGTERFADGSSHASLWLIDAGGNGARIGCDPTEGGPGVVALVLSAPPGVYAVLGSANDRSSSFDYRIVQFDR